LKTAEVDCCHLCADSLISVY